MSLRLSGISQLLTVVVALTLSASPQSASPCDPLIDKAFRVTGTQQEVADIPEFALQFAQSMGTRVDPASSRIFKRALAAEPWLKDLRSVFRKDCDTTMLQAVVSAMDTDLGTRIREVERTQQGPSTAPARALFYRDMRLHPPSDLRDQLAIRIEKATEAPEMSWQIVEATSMAVSKANGIAISETDIAMLRQKFQPLLQSAVLLDVLFIYRNISNQDLEQYATALESPSYRQFNHTLSEAIADTFALRMTTALKELRGRASAKQ